MNVSHPSECNPSSINLVENATRTLIRTTARDQAIRFGIQNGKLKKTVSGYFARSD